MTWENSVDLGYGILRQTEELFGTDNGKWIKTDDRFDITSKYGQRASKHWYYAGLMNFRTQTTAGYDYAVDDVTEISGFLAPGYLLSAIGMDYKPNDKFSLFVAPFTSKLTFVNDSLLANAGAFGVDKAFVDANTGLYTSGRKFRSEFGDMREFSSKLNWLQIFRTLLNWICLPIICTILHESILTGKIWWKLNCGNFYLQP